LGAVTEFLLTLSAITKRYPGVLALDGVDLALAPGAVHALVGENGAGKSTLLKILAGAERPDGGTITLDGAAVRFAAPRDALARGITVIYQEFALVPELSASANVLLGMEPGRHGLLDLAAERERAAEALASLGATFDPATPVAALAVAERQLVELARALVRRARVIALDEPTATLSHRETEHLFARVLALKAQGLAIVFVSHRLEEVRRIADAVTVLRDGRRVWTGAAAGVSDAQIVRHMVGRDVEMERVLGRSAPGDVVLHVAGLTRAPAFHDVSFSLRRGEIVALAGLVGAGRTEVARCLAGADPWDAGEVLVRNARYRPATPREAIERGVVYLPEERKTLGLVLGMTVRENTTLAALGRFSRFGVLRRAAEGNAATAQAQALDLRPPDIERPAATLSGGNQQKVVMGKWLLTDADVLIVDEPTRGVDVGAKSEIHRRIRALADAGKAVLVVSSELPEVLALADRILVMCEGRVTGDLDGARASAEQVLQLALPAGRAA
jgi:ABC-type sugar transport system ATPase subunit